MYGKAEASQLRQQFWTTFGQYLAPVLSAESVKINWINYKTGEKDIYFRMNTGDKKATIAIEITHRDEALQARYFQQFQQLKTSLQNALNEAWTWQPAIQNESGKIVSLIFTELADVSVLNRSHWPQLISFFKPRIMALDGWWISAKYSFETMR